jgi:hypothetical protein
MKCIQKTMERFVHCDLVYSNKIVSETAKIFDIDLNTCTVDDLQFASEYSVKI